MMFGRDGWRARAPRLLAALGAALLLAACGGGDQVDPFVPGRVIAFGDEASVVEDDGDKFTVNFVSDTGVKDCVQNPAWVQTVAGHYGLSFPECVGTGRPTGVIEAQPGATVAGVTAQIDAFLQRESFRSDDLVTIHAGAHDIWALFDPAVAPGTPAAAALAAQARQIGAALAAQVNRVAQLGARVLIVTVPDQGLTPEGRESAQPGTLREITGGGAVQGGFNAGLRTGIINDGRLIGLVLFDETVQSLANNVNFNTTDRACSDEVLALAGGVLNCTTATLRTNASTSSWLWADDRNFAPLGHSTLGSLAVNRAVNNPF
ncbi:MAG TPA: hypothetical protein VFZ93_10785 [Albitalea sp.]